MINSNDIPERSNRDAKVKENRKIKFKIDWTEYAGLT